MSSPTEPDDLFSPGLWLPDDDPLTPDLLSGGDRLTIDVRDLDDLGGGPVDLGLHLLDGSVPDLLEGPIHDSDLDGLEDHLR